MQALGVEVQAGREGCKRKYERQRSVVMEVLGVLSTDHGCTSEQLEEDEEERQGCLGRGLEEVEEEAGRRWGSNSTCWEVGEEGCLGALLCQHLPGLARRCGGEGRCTPPHHPARAPV